LFGAAGYITWKQHVSVESQSLKYHFAWYEWIVAWESLQYWFVDKETDSDFRQRRCAKFFVSDNKDPVIEVREYEAADPGFEQFIADVRSHVGSKERVGDPRVATGVGK
jgi:hypothetical protein